LQSKIEREIRGGDEKGVEGAKMGLEEAHEESLDSSGSNRRRDHRLTFSLAATSTTLLAIVLLIILVIRVHFVACHVHAASRCSRKS